jgi:hypothetical protein
MVGAKFGGTKMMLRRVIEHVRKQEWTAVGIDFLIVVLGVFIGIQVSNWNQARVDRDKSTAYRQRLVHELQFNAHQFRQQTAYYKSVKRHGLAALASLEGRGGSFGEAFAVDAYQATQMDLRPPKRFVFDELVSAGLVGLLGGDALQQMASDYYLSLETNVPQMSEAPPYRDIVRRAMPYGVQARIRQRCGDRTVYLGKQPIGASLPENCPLGVSGTEISEAVRRVRAVPHINADLTRYLSAIDQKLSVLRGTTRETQQLVGALQAE